MGSITNFTGVAFPPPQLAGLTKDPPATPPLVASLQATPRSAMLGGQHNASMPASALAAAIAQSVPAPARTSSWSVSAPDAQAVAHISAEEAAASSALFDRLDPGGSGFLDGATCKGVLVQSGLPTAELRRIWDLADLSHDGRLDRHEFAVAQHLIRLRRAGCELPAALPPALRDPAASTPAASATATALGTDRGPASVSARYQLSYSQPNTPALTPAAFVTPGARTAEAPGMAGPAQHVRQALFRPPGRPPDPADAALGGDAAFSLADYARFAALFAALDADQDGFISGLEARGVLTKSGLPNAELRKVWELADMTADGRLDQHEFAVAQILVAARQQGHALPETLPASLRAPPPRGADGAAGSATAFPLPLLHEPSPAASPAISALSARSAAGAATLSRASSMSSARGSLSRGDGRGGAATDPFASSAAAYTQHAAEFAELDADQDGFISGLEARGVLTKSGLPNAELRKVWELADMTADGRLDQHEFAVAQILVAARQQGHALPETLPASLRAPLSLDRSVPLPLPSPRSSPTRGPEPTQGDVPALSAAPAVEVVAAAPVQMPPNVSHESPALLAADMAPVGAGATRGGEKEMAAMQPAAKQTAATAVPVSGWTSFDATDGLSVADSSPRSVDGLAAQQHSPADEMPDAQQRSSPAVPAAHFTPLAVTDAFADLVTETLQPSPPHQDPPPGLLPPQSPLAAAAAPADSAAPLFDPGADPFGSVPSGAPAGWAATDGAGASAAVVAEEWDPFGSATLEPLAPCGGAVVEPFPTGSADAATAEATAGQGRIDMNTPPERAPAAPAEARAGDGRCSLTLALELADVSTPRPCSQSTAQQPPAPQGGYSRRAARCSGA